MPNRTIYNPGRKPSFKPIGKKVKYEVAMANAVGTAAGRKPIDWGLVARMAHVGVTPQEMCFFLELTEATLRQYEEFSSIYKKNFCAGNVSLRRRQYRKAMAGDTQMLKWLGIQRLGQRDAVQISGDPLNPLEVNAQNIDLSRLSVEQLRQLEALYAVAELPAGEQTIEVQALPEPTEKAKVNGKANGRNGKRK